MRRLKPSEIDVVLRRRAALPVAGRRTAGAPPTRSWSRTPTWWQRLDAAVKHHTVHWRWVRGHSGHDLNERADELAREGIADVKAEKGYDD